VRFATASTQISVRWRLREQPFAMVHMPATGVSGVDLYVEFNGSLRWLAIGMPGEPELRAERTIVSNLEAAERRYTLYLPLYNGVDRVEIGVDDGRALGRGRANRVAAHVRIAFTARPSRKAVCASRPGMVFTSILGRRLNRPHFNLGFSGNGKSEPEIADLLTELDPSVFVLDQAGNTTPQEIDERVEPMVRKLRAAHPATPIVMVEMVTYQNAYLDRPEPRRQRRPQRRVAQGVRPVDCGEDRRAALRAYRQSVRRRRQRDGRRRARQRRRIHADRRRAGAGPAAAGLDSMPSQETTSTDRAAAPEVFAALGSFDHSRHG
jgi:hypothetical protein